MCNEANCSILRSQCRSNRSNRSNSPRRRKLRSNQQTVKDRVSLQSSGGMVTKKISQSIVKLTQGTIGATKVVRKGLEVEEK